MNIVERLRRSWPRPKDGALGDLHEAADTIERLCSALEPFVKVFEEAEDKYRRRGGNPDSFTDEHASFAISPYKLRMGVFREAAFALSAAKGAGE